MKWAFFGLVAVGLIVKMWIDASPTTVPATVTSIDTSLPNGFDVSTLALLGAAIVAGYEAGFLKG